MITFKKKKKKKNTSGEGCIDCGLSLGREPRRLRLALSLVTHRLGNPG